MVKMIGSEDFYPTPVTFLKEIARGLNWDKIQYVLEPSAGRGNIAEFVRNETKYVSAQGWNYDRKKVDIDCVEIEPELRSILTGKNFRVVHDDFLTFRTYKHYDLVFMNPPFSQGAKHLLKAIEVQSLSGGMIICILNAETIRNVCTNERNLLGRKLKEFNAEIMFYENAFAQADNPTNVEVAVVKITIPEVETKNPIFEELRKGNENFRRYENIQDKDLTPFDLIERAVSRFNFEVNYGLKLWKEYRNFQKISLQVSDGAYALTQADGLILGINTAYHNYDDFRLEDYVKYVRLKYWGYLFTHPIFIAGMTTNLRKEYLKDLEQLADFDFLGLSSKLCKEILCRLGHSLSKFNKEVV